MRGINCLAAFEAKNSLDQDREILEVSHILPLEVEHSLVVLQDIAEL